MSLTVYTTKDGLLTGTLPEFEEMMDKYQEKDFDTIYFSFSDELKKALRPYIMKRLKKYMQKNYYK